ncbi:Shedu anti-phage system protein SduA domain-containing protein [Georgenia muralis]
MEDKYLQESAGSVREVSDGDELALFWTDTGHESEGVEVLRYVPEAGLVRIFPKVRKPLQGLLDQFDQVTEIQLDAAAISWYAAHHTGEGDNGHLQAVGLPRGFESTYVYGVGIEGGYQGIVREVEEHTDCTVLRIGDGGLEGPEDEVFRISFERFRQWVVSVKRNRRRGTTAVRRVNEAEQHNILADLLGLDKVEPVFARNAAINTITEFVEKGYIYRPADRIALVEQVVAEAPRVAKENPAKLGALRLDLELVTLDVLIKRFEVDIAGSTANSEPHWQTFFKANPFALQQLLAAPVTLYREHLHVKGGNAEGQGGRITDFACINPITLSAFVIEIKKPATTLMTGTAYRGNGGAEIYPPSAELSGAVTQVLAQVSSMREHFPALRAQTPSLGPIDPQDVSGALIIGRVDALAPLQLASFKRFRASLSGVVILGFDEVLQRLKGLHEMLSTPPVVRAAESAESADARESHGERRPTGEAGTARTTAVG